MKQATSSLLCAAVDVSAIELVVAIADESGPLVVLSYENTASVHRQLLRKLCSPG